MPCHSQSALAGPNSRSEGLAVGVSAPRAALTAGSCATWARESGQVRKEAALSGCRGCRRRARPEPKATDTPGGPSFEGGRTVHFSSIARLAAWKTPATLDARGPDPARRGAARGGAAPGREPHVLFQALTICARLDDPGDGDSCRRSVTEHGDQGLGTQNGLDGAMITSRGGGSTERRRRGRDRPRDSRAEDPVRWITRSAPRRSPRRSEGRSSGFSLVRREASGERLHVAGRASALRRRRC